ncbi:MAG: hypothetical protein JOZ24_08550 [Candidatus Eremiobacteraeota bacterium]|nr:hypothetical protein [Candidatus Eremiobacteraeota bacterium]
MSEHSERDPRLIAIPDTHGHAKGEHKPYIEERPLPLTARMLFLWFYHACRRGYPRFLMVSDHINYLTFEDPAAVNLVRRALKLAQAGDLYGAAEAATVDVAHAAVVSEGLRRGMRFSIGAEVDNDPRARPDAQNIVDAMRPDAIVRAVHFVPAHHPVHGENWNWPFDNPEFREIHDVVGTEQLWESYVNLIVDAVDRLPGHILAHFYVPAVFGWWPDLAKLEQYEDRVLDALAAKGMAVEFNTRFLYREDDREAKQRYLEANRRLLRKANDRGVAIAIGADAHSPKDQGGAFELVLPILDELEINEIVFPIAGSLRRVALKVREPEMPRYPEPVRAASGADASDHGAGAAEPARPIRKARPVAKPTRAPETSPERTVSHGERHAATERDGEASGGSVDERTLPPPAETTPPPAKPKAKSKTETPRVNSDRPEDEERRPAPGAPETQRPTAPQRERSEKPPRGGGDRPPPKRGAPKAPGQTDLSQRIVEAATGAVVDVATAAVKELSAKRALKPVAAKVKAAAKAVGSAAAKVVGKKGAAKKRAGAKKAAPKKGRAAKAGAKKPATRGGARRTSSATTRSRKAPAKRGSAKRGSAKRSTAKRSTAKRSAPKKSAPTKSAAKRSGAKRSAGKKAAPKKSTRRGASARSGAKKAAKKSSRRR